MKTVSIYEKYEAGFIPPADEVAASMVFVAEKGNLLVRHDGKNVVFPCASDIDFSSVSAENIDYLGEYEKQQCYCINYAQDIKIPEGMVFENLRTLLPIIDANLGLLAGRAIHIANWNRTNKFCGVCGNRTELKQDERARKCVSCGNVIYPRISPAIIIAVVNGDKLLLAHNKNFQGNRYSVIAGFMEPGETFEDCAKREVFEEVGIKIKNIEFFGNQPWPFPDSLMIGLTAEYESGNLKPDGVEIDDACWYSKDELPEVPGTISIAGRLIEWFVQK